MGAKLTGLEAKIAGLKLKNPVMVASGTFGYGQEYKDLVKIGDIGAIITKSITLKASQGNPPPRIWESTAGMLNAIGLQNDGVEDFIANKLPFLKGLRAKIIVSIAGSRKQEYGQLARILDNTPVDALELNISCPNVEHSGESRLFAQDARATAEIVRSVKKATGKAVITKLSPNVTDITEIARAAERAGTDAISLINTLIGLDVDVAAQRPYLGSATGGLSGPAIRPVALRMVWETYRAVKVPLIGIGGIMDTEDALAFFLCGASAIQVGTANFVNPQTAVNIISGIRGYLKEKRLKNIEQIRGKLRL